MTATALSKRPDLTATETDISPHARKPEGDAGRTIAALVASRDVAAAMADKFARKAATYAGVGGLSTMEQAQRTADTYAAKAHELDRRIAVRRAIARQHAAMAAAVRCRIIARHCERRGSTDLAFAAREIAALERRQAHIALGTARRAMDS